MARDGRQVMFGSRASDDGVLLRNDDQVGLAIGRHLEFLGRVLA